LTVDADLDRLRAMGADLDPAVRRPRLRLPRKGSLAFAGAITSGGTAGQFALVNPLAIVGNEVAVGGAPAGLGGEPGAPGAGPVLAALNVGPGNASVGEQVVVRFVTNRWVFERSGSDGGSTGDKTVCATVKACDGTGAKGVAITITGPAGFSKSCTTSTDISSSGQCCVAASATGSYCATIASVTHCVSVTRPGSFFIPQLCQTPGFGTVCAHFISQCGTPRDGLTVTAGSVTGVTDAAGKVCLCVPVGSGSLVTSGIAGYQTLTIPYTVSSECSGVDKGGFLMALATGYGEVCCGCGGAAGGGGIGSGSTYPVPDPLLIVDPKFGTTALTWVAGSSLWKGTSAVVGGKQVGYEFGDPGHSLGDPCFLRIAWIAAPLGGSDACLIRTSSCPPAYAATGTAVISDATSYYAPGPTVTFFIHQ
jgi:hypothetical protein